MLPPGQYSIGWRRQGSEVQIGAEHSWAPWPCRAPPTCLSPPLTCPPTWQTRCPATASARGKLFLGSELELDELGITYQAIPPLGLTQQQLVVFFFNYFLVFPRCSMLRGCLRTDCSLLAARGREEEEAAMPTRSPTSPPGGAQGAQDLPQPPIRWLKNWNSSQTFKVDSPWYLRKYLGAQGAQDLPQPPNVLHRTLKSFRHVSPLYISFFYYIPIALCYIRILWDC